MSIKLNIGLRKGVFVEYDITPTIFPDGTSQVWQLSKKIEDHINGSLDGLSVVWEFENEAELIHVCQLAHLLAEGYGVGMVCLVVPYLPYGRQDKPVANDQSFALNTFGLILSKFFCSVSTTDAHSNVISDHITLFDFSPCNGIERIFNEDGHNLICFPDKGASTRYSIDEGISYCCLKKVRDQLTGDITGLDLDVIDGSVNAFEIEGKDVLIVDDICDGGRTFIEATKLLKNLKAKSVSLYVTHGIFSKGTQILFDAGLSQIYTSKGEVKNEDQPILAN